MDEELEQRDGTVIVRRAFQKKMNDPTECPHSQIVRIMDSWKCVNCPALFEPVNKRHKTKWPEKPTS